MILAPNGHRPPTSKQLLSCRSSLRKDVVNSGGSGTAPQGEKVLKKFLSALV